MAHELEEALTRIAEIREGIARAGTFRGYRAPMVACSGAVAVSAGFAQYLFVPAPADAPGAYAALWVSAAAANLVAMACGLALRCRRAASSHETRMTLLAAEHFLPSVLAGGALTAMIVRISPASLWLLPGLWPVIFGLGVFASARLVSPALFWVGAFYLLAGTYWLSQGPDGPALSPWTMSATFGCGQFATAVILHHAARRSDDV